MPYPMIHLYIAKHILDLSLWPVKSRPQYYLGTLAPDAVQFRQTYDKKISHICSSNEPWGFVSNNEEWRNDIVKFIEENKDKADIDFLLGYGIHILADICNNIKIWTPFRLKNANMDFRELHKAVYEENMLIDLQLYQMCTFKEELFESLSSSVSFNFLDIVYMEDMDKIKDSIVNVQYNNKAPVNSESNRIVILKNILEFIDYTTGNLRETLCDRILEKIKRSC